MDTPTDQLHCTKCKTDKAISEFWKRNTFKRKYSFWCIDCEYEQRQERHLKHPEKLKEINEYSKAWQKTYRGRMAVKLSAVRRYNYNFELKLDGFISWFESYKDCVLCDKDLTKMELRERSIDHITPICMGGTSELGNLRVVCIKCNERRRTKRPFYK